MEFWKNIFKVSEKNANVNNSNNVHENIYLSITTYLGYPGLSIHTRENLYKAKDVGEKRNCSKTYVQMPTMTAGISFNMKYYQLKHVHSQLSEQLNRKFRKMAPSLAHYRFQTYMKVL